ncbi:acetylesterase [Lachnoclostridium sp. An169]|uniref:alpha/beta hydrolase n=1 Tax=Lachnoclostridium sp. An169 TaxID=1965569 RepID=UPI000B37B82F|nr:alpha/beta hydrolase family protein [Lachnoclostridium sp. An169]OUP85120.1 acetylesterase [Lachnoclostridium sp. An169]HJA64759.1 esterase family protein [Candidatus Mediterraneibacter cottocaccae]
MALIQVNFLSKSLRRTVPMYVILPADRMLPPGAEEKPDTPYKTLYLLHGVIGNYTDWVTGTAVQRWAEEKNLVVVMPSGDNSFYLDQESGQNSYGEFVGQEIVEITRKMFPLSGKREDTYIAGLSMGGYGALRNGLKYSETFGRIGAFSSALITEGVKERTDDSPRYIETRSYAQSILGDLEKVGESDRDPRWLVEKLKKEGKKIPEIFMTCGKQDSLLGQNHVFRDFLIDAGADVTYEEWDGGHEWDFWNSSLKKLLEWLPLEEREAGISSGNVGL